MFAVIVGIVDLLLFSRLFVVVPLSLQMLLFMFLLLLLLVVVVVVFRKTDIPSSWYAENACLEGVKNRVHLGMHGGPV